MCSYKIDYHMHCHASFDSSASIDEMVLNAIERGFEEICMTDHWDIMIREPSTQIFDFEARDKELDEAIERYKGKIVLRKGIELGQPFKNENKYKELMDLARGRLDYIIGSLHNLYEDTDIAFMDFKSIDLNKLYEDYISKLILMVEQYDFDMLGHITYPSRYMYEKAAIRYDELRLKELFEELFRKTVSMGKGIEINTSGYFRGLNETMPNIELLKLYKECGGELVTIGSDAHAGKNVGIGFDKGIEKLKACGFRYYASFCGRNPVMRNLY